VGGMGGLRRRHLGDMTSRAVYTLQKTSALEKGYLMVNRHGRLRVLVLGVVVLGLAGSVAAQEYSPNFWGLGTNFHFVSAEEFQTASPDLHYWGHSSDGFWRLGFPLLGDCYATLRLPTGSLVTGMTVIYRDDSGQDLLVRLLQQWVTTAGTADTTQIGPTFQSSGTPGITASWMDIDPDHTILYVDGLTAQSYVIRFTAMGDSALYLRGVIIGWNRQISPAPAVATFADVPVGAFGFQHIEALAASGITAGCGGGNFCPNDTLTRAQMAVFLAKALGLHWAP
jgi:hypothetical protein